MKVTYILVLTAALAVGLFVTTPLHAAPDVQNHDSAFSLLITAFGEVQDSLIENDYQNRIEAAAAIKDENTREYVIGLAKQERELRLRKLNRKLAELSAAYVHVREPSDEATASDPVPPTKVDIAGAQQKLTRFVVIGSAVIEPQSETNTPIADERR